MVAALALAAVTACDTGDGRTLRPPTEPPPATSAPLVTDPSFDEGGELPAEPLPTIVDRPFELFAAWRDGATIDPRHGCDGEDVSPALTWTGVPDGTVELAIVVVDEDAGGFLHWLVTGIDPSVVSTFEGSAPPGALEWENSFGRPGWAGPCPPDGETHTYRFTLHALNQQLELADDSPSDLVIALVDETTIASTSITGGVTR